MTTIGPVEYVILGFPVNNFGSGIAPELAKLVNGGVIRLIDLTFISKDPDGNVTVLEYDAHESLASLAGLSGEIGGLLTEEDVRYAALGLEPNSSAALLVWEDLWATPFTTAVQNAGGVVLEGARIPHQLIESAMAELAETTA